VDRLDGKVAVVTGSASGLGRAMAERFAREGMTAVIADNRPTEAEVVAKEIERAGGRAVAIEVDVTRRASMVALCVGTSACKDPNPTFVFDAATDGAKEGGGDGSGQTDGAAGTGGGGAGAAGTTGTAGGGGAGTGGGGGGGGGGTGGGATGGAAAGTGGQAGTGGNTGGTGGSAGAGGAS